MEKKRGVVSHFGGVIRIIILIISVAVITFFVVRFVRNREAVRNAERSLGGSQTQTKSDSKKSDQNNSGKDSSSSDDSEGKGPESAAIPSGISDDSVDDTASTHVPAAGMGTNMVTIAVFLGAMTYFIVKRYQDAR